MPFANLFVCCFVFCSSPYNAGLFQQRAIWGPPMSPSLFTEVWVTCQCAPKHCGKGSAAVGRWWQPPQLGRYLRWLGSFRETTWTVWRPVVGEANVGGLWRRATLARHIAATLRTEPRSRDVGSCVDGQRRFYFPRETSQLCAFSVTPRWMGGRQESFLSRVEVSFPPRGEFVSFFSFSE